MLSNEPLSCGHQYEIVHAVTNVKPEISLVSYDQLLLYLLQDKVSIPQTHAKCYFTCEVQENKYPGDFLSLDDLLYINKENKYKFVK